MSVELPLWVSGFMVFTAVFVLVVTIVLTWDYLQAETPEPRRTEIRERLDQLETEFGKRATRVDQTRIADITTRRTGGAQ